MDAAKTMILVKDEMRSCAERLIRAVDNCDTAEDINPMLQACRQDLQAAAAMVGKVIQEG